MLTAEQIDNWDQDVAALALERSALAFTVNPSPLTAGAYLEALMGNEAEGLITDEHFLDCLAGIRDWLLASEPEGEPA